MSICESMISIERLDKVDKVVEDIKKEIKQILNKHKIFLFKRLAYWRWVSIMLAFLKSFYLANQLQRYFKVINYFGVYGEVAFNLEPNIVKEIINVVVRHAKKLE